MKKFHWIFLLLAFAGAACIVGFGISVAAENIVGVIVSAILFIFIMGFGFMRKKKMRENGTL
ncbi:YlaF family protein [Bacillus benzoevorans]|uniref:YlaF family protein n=1 Tax=Bacillus benzoevorans TaxID=1456 RepID=A0A7X0HMZ1_9BACI|nr:YlaF family protein [Bacillus benzoevorans]MBB6443694.1 hypothetical protein [Bacillus benzoevorans]